MITVHIADSRSIVLPQDEVALVVTSPPYWCIKDYQCPQQIGYGQTYEQYLSDLEAVWRKCFDALFPGGRMCIVVGDQFLRASEHGRYHVAPIRADTTVSCCRLGFDYMGCITWQKTTTCRPSGGAHIMGSYPYPRNGIVKIDSESILIFKKQGKAPRPSTDTKESSAMTREEWNRYFSGTWSIPGVAQTDHPAAFPLEIPYRLIKMFSFVGETVLDPFLGSGTTLKACHATGRNGIGVEINPAYAAVLKATVPGCTVEGGS